MPLKMKVRNVLGARDDMRAGRRGHGPGYLQLPSRPFLSSAATQIVMTAPLTAPLSASVRGSGAPEGVRGVRGDSVNFRPLWGYARSVSPMPWGAWPEERAMQAAVGARSARIVGVVLVFLATGLASFSEAKPPASTGPTIKVLSNRPDLISGGDALVEILNAGTGSLRATNYPNGGPIFSGPQIQPWPCLAGATDAQ